MRKIPAIPIRKILFEVVEDLPGAEEKLQAALRSRADTRKPLFINEAAAVPIPPGAIISRAVRFRQLWGRWE